MLFLPTRQILAAFASTVLMASASTHEPPLQSAWKLAEANLFNDSNSVFRKLKGQPQVDERERAFGEAVTYLNVQPRTPQNIARSQELLKTLADGADSYAPLAGLYLARIEEAYLTPPEPARAQAAYLTLLKQKTGNPLVESSAVRLALMAELSAPDPESRKEALLSTRSLSQYLLTREGRRDFHLNLGLALIKAGDIATGLEELLAADAAGITRPLTQRVAWVTIAEAARVTGNNELAAKYYRMFLEKHQRDTRSYMIELRLKEVEPPKP